MGEFSHQTGSTSITDFNVVIETSLLHAQYHERIKSVKQYFLFILVITFCLNQYITIVDLWISHFIDDFDFEKCIDNKALSSTLLLRLVDKNPNVSIWLPMQVWNRCSSSVLRQAPRQQVKFRSLFSFRQLFWMAECKIFIKYWPQYNSKQSLPDRNRLLSSL